MGRLIVLLVLAYLLALWLGSAVKRLRSSSSRLLTPERGAAEPLSRCSLCGIYIPSSRSLAGPEGQDVYCSETCRRKAP